MDWLRSRFYSTASAATNANEANDGMSFIHQRGSKLLELPLEVRLAIYDYMDLSTETSDCLQWMGAYFTCRQLHTEMSNALKPQNNLKKIAEITCRLKSHSVTLVEACPLQNPLGQLYSVTIKLPVQGPDFCCESTLVELYVATSTSIYTLYDFLELTRVQLHTLPAPPQHNLVQQHLGLNARRLEVLHAPNLLRQPGTAELQSHYLHRREPHRSRRRPI